MRKLFILALTLSASLHARPSSGYYINPEVDELRIELDDLKHALTTTQVELNLLDERLRKQDNSKGKTLSSESLLSSQITTLEKRIGNLEKTFDKVATDLRALNTSVAQTLSKIQNLEGDLTSHDKRLDEVAKLKGTLTSISKAIGQRSADEPTTATKSYRVKAGDSLEKIARVHHVTVDSLRKLNNLSNDKIVIGQELRLASDAP